MKYGNRKIVYNGQTYDSTKEFQRALHLELLQKAGEITELRRQVKYVLIPAQREPDKGKRKGKLLERECAYIADFVYVDCHTEETVVEDVKGVKTKEYVIKRKLMLWRYGIRIKEV